MKTYKVEMKLDVIDDGCFDVYKALTHHVEWLIDLESWPEIINVKDVVVTTENSPIYYLDDKNLN